jgi:leucyl-tRNA synthetase
MKLLNALERAPSDDNPGGQKAAVIAEGFSILLRVLSPITPHITHTLWVELGYGGDILAAPWPQVDESALVQDELELVLQINGKLRGSIKVAASADKAAIEAIALASEVAVQHMNGAAPKKVVVVPGRLVNIVC